MAMTESLRIFPFLVNNLNAQTGEDGKYCSSENGIQSKKLGNTNTAERRWVMPPLMKTIRRETTYVPAIPQVMAVRAAARKALVKYW